MNKPVYMSTFSGRIIDLEKFDGKRDIDIRDIAISLARQRRYAGHTAVPWTVGQHSILCATISMELGSPQDLIECCFLHDVEETYVQDVIHPIKRNYTMASYDDLSNRIAHEIYEFFGHADLRNSNLEIIHAVDQAAFWLEAKTLIPQFKYLATNFDALTNDTIEKLIESDYTLPRELLDMDDSQVAQELYQILNVIHAQHMLGKEIAT